MEKITEEFSRRWKWSFGILVILDEVSNWLFFNSQSIRKCRGFKKIHGKSIQLNKECGLNKEFQHVEFQRPNGVIHFIFIFLFWKIKFSTKFLLKFPSDSNWKSHKFYKSMLLKFEVVLKSRADSKVFGNFMSFLNRHLIIVQFFPIPYMLRVCMFNHIYMWVMVWSV